MTLIDAIVTNWKQIEEGPIPDHLGIGAALLAQMRLVWPRLTDNTHYWVVARNLMKDPPSTLPTELRVLFDRFYAMVYGVRFEVQAAWKNDVLYILQPPVYDYRDVKQVLGDSLFRKLYFGTWTGDNDNRPD
jgi:hypothetical protein